MERKVLGSRRAYARIDLVIVTALAAVVLPLLVPVLRDTDQKAGVAECLANLRQVMQATGSYLNDYDDELLLAASAMDGVCTWAFGGQTNDAYWKTDTGGLFYVRATDRPLNPYLLGGQVQPDVVDGGSVVARTPVPMLRCPADRTSHQRLRNGDGVTNVSCYDDVGTSYQYNLHAVSDVNWYGDENPWEQPGDWNEIARALVRSVLNGQADRFTFYLEDPMDWGLREYDRSIEIGNHAEFGKHSCGYLDGHADYAYRDTRGWCGPGWEAINTDWIRRVDYTPPVYYQVTLTDKNCDPP